MPDEIPLPKKVEKPSEERVLSELAKLNRRMSLMEERFSNIRDNIDLIENNLVDKHKSANSGIADVGDKIKDFGNEIGDLKNEIGRLASRMEQFSTKQDVKVLERYINFWNPLDIAHKRNAEIKLGELR